MKLTRRVGWNLMGFGAAATVLLLAGEIGSAQEKPAEGVRETEHKITEAATPKAALEALRKLAGGAQITEVSEEVEDGRKYYEGSWTKDGAKIDALVTTGGDVVEIEETIGADAAPAAIRAAIAKEAGKDGKVIVEKKTIIQYEITYRKDGKKHELVLTPDGRRVEDEDDGENGDEDHESDSKKP